MQVPGAQNVKVQVTSEGKALVEFVQDVLLLLLLMACGETSNATTVWELSSLLLLPRGNSDRSRSRSQTWMFLFFGTGKKRRLDSGWGCSLEYRCVLVVDSTMGKSIRLNESGNMRWLPHGGVRRTRASDQGLTRDWTGGCAGPVAEFKL